MALVLGMRVGNSVYLGDTKVKLVEIVNSTTLILKVGNEKHTITDTQPIELVGVLVGVGNFQDTDKVARVMFTAPSSITILRHSLYQEARKLKGVTGDCS